MKKCLILLALLGSPLLLSAMPPQDAPQPAAASPSVTPPKAPADATRSQVLRGEYGRYRANNDVRHYHLNIRVNPETRSLSGKNTIRFKMLEDDSRIQLELYANLNVDKILLGETPLKYERELNTVFVDFPEMLKAGQEYAIDFHYNGNFAGGGRGGRGRGESAGRGDGAAQADAAAQGSSAGQAEGAGQRGAQGERGPAAGARRGRGTRGGGQPRGITFSTDPAGRPWIVTSCEGPGASAWWPNKDQWRDEAESADISVAVPNDLMNVSNGRFVGKENLGDGYTRWNWRVTYPINSYCISMNIAKYEHFNDSLGDLTMDYYVLPEDLERAQEQFAQAKPMMEAFYHYFGEYPFKRDGYKLVHVPYAGMEHQSAVTYGNGFRNGYGGRDWTFVGVSMKFDFIIIHESGHEWFGNAVSAADVSDMWIHEGWCTYLECMYVEKVFGRDDALAYTNGYKRRVQNRTPIITTRAVHQSPPGDQYFKGALFLHTLRSVMNDDTKWWALIRETYDRFKYKNIMTEDIIALFNERFGTDLTPVFNQYLRYSGIPTLELAFDEAAGSVRYRWQADEPGFNMPIKVGSKENWQTIKPTSEWQALKTPLKADAFEVATDLFYVNVAKNAASN